MELPIFPLNTVLFPGAAIPLHIFEERYKQMIALCLTKDRPFGLVLIRRGSEVGGTAEPFEVGTTAHIARVERLAEGRMNLLCWGGRRFRIVHTVGYEPYLVAEVEMLSSPAEDVAQLGELAETVGALFAEYTRLYLAMSNQWARTIEMPSRPDALADFIASRLTVSLWTKQRLLEELSTRRRLEEEMDLLGDAIRELAPRVEAGRSARWRGFGAMS